MFEATSQIQYFKIGFALFSCATAAFLIDGEKKSWLIELYYVIFGLTLM
jgi:hypothetical protein